MSELNFENLLNQLSSNTDNSSFQPKDSLEKHDYEIDAALELISGEKYTKHRKGYAYNIVELINNTKDIELCYEKMDYDISGYIEYIESNGKYKFKVCVNETHSKQRNNFTLAHEFGHYLMDTSYLIENKKIKETILFRSDNDYSTREKNANKFAMSLLIPDDLIKKAVDDDGIRNIKALAVKFNVSIAAIRYVLHRLGYIKEY